MLAERASADLALGTRASPIPAMVTAARSARAVRKISALGEMTGGIAHDFRNILCIIASGLRVAERVAEDSAELRSALAATQEGVERGLLMTSRLLAFATHQELNDGPEDVNVLLDKLRGFLRYGAGPGIRVTVDLGRNLPECLVDPPQFNSAILNLVVNARDAMPNGGVIHISTASVANEPRSGVGQAYVRVRVHDNGSGMSPETVQNIFDPYFTTKGDSGTGLGLPQVHALMQQVCGELKVHSKFGAGTSFDLLFPVAHKVSPTPDMARQLDRWADEGGAIAPLPSMPAIKEKKGKPCSRSD